MDSLADKLEKDGYLSVHQLARYLKECHPIAAVTHPTLLRYIREGKLRAQYPDQPYHTKVEKEEIERFIKEGVRKIEVGDPSPPLSNGSKPPKESE